MTILSSRLVLWLLLLSGIVALVQSQDDQTCLAGDDSCTEEPEQDDTKSAKCSDGHEQCPFWASSGECEENPRYMAKHCRKSCDLCANTTDGSDLGEPQNVSGSKADEARALIEKTREYIKNEVMVDPKYEKVKLHCKNQHANCAFWAVIGECENNPGYMNVNCAPSCQSCDQLLYETRCPYDPETMPDVWGPGDLNRMFEKITTDEQFKKFEPRILSRPSHPAEKKESSAPEKEPTTIKEPAEPEGTSPKEEPSSNETSPLKKLFNKIKMPFRRDKTAESEGSDEYQIGPWVVILNNFATPEECDALIQLGHDEGYKRSSDVGKLKFDGSFDSNVNDGRTSLNAWCRHNCYEDPRAKNVIEKVKNVTGIPETNSEYLQLLKYEVGEFYRTHHDYIGHDVDRPQGVRLITVFLYLNDVEEGGGTDFPDLKLTVQPKRGGALIWPSVLDKDPNAKDGRTSHQALPVKKGTKFGANAWLHMRDFKTPNNNGCT